MRHIIRKHGLTARVLSDNGAGCVDSFSADREGIVEQGAAKY